MRDEGVDVDCTLDLESSTMTETRGIALKQEQKTHLFDGYTAMHVSVGHETTASRTKG